jgi:hypothetical protein
MKPFLVVLALLTACATSTQEPADNGSGTPGTGSNTGSGSGSGDGSDSTPLPGGGVQCNPSYEHACGPQCAPNQENNVDVGCAMGCGDACKSPLHGHPVCTDAGVCAVACDTGYSLSGDQCVAEGCSQVGYSCGTLETASGSVDCGTCMDGATCGGSHQCQIARDGKEVNDSLALATQLGEYNDAANQQAVIHGLSIDSTSDVDWFRFHITDGFDGGNPDGYITLSHNHVISGSDVGWLSSRHQLTVWFKCDGDDNGSSVECGEWYSTTDTDSLHDPSLGVGCTVDATYLVWAHVSASCKSLSDNGTVVFRVRKTNIPMGDTYDLTTKVE